MSGDAYAGIGGGATKEGRGLPQQANAALIAAAAPELLEALQALFADYKALADSGDAGNWKLEERNAGKQALAAIAKATEAA